VGVLQRVVSFIFMVALAGRTMPGGALTRRLLMPATVGIRPALRWLSLQGKRVSPHDHSFGAREVR